jgi:hypothetical protein
VARRGCFPAARNNYEKHCFRIRLRAERCLGKHGSPAWSAQHGLHHKPKPQLRKTKSVQPRDRRTTTTVAPGMLPQFRCVSMATRAGLSPTCSNADRYNFTTDLQDPGFSAKHFDAHPTSTNIHMATGLPIVGRRWRPRCPGINFGTRLKRPVSTTSSQPPPKPCQSQPRDPSPRT